MASARRIIDLRDAARESLRRDFVANVSHELKAPVGALTLLAEAMAGETDIAVLRRLADRVQVEAERMDRMIADLLDFSRSERDAWRDSDLVPVSDIVADAVDRVRPAAHARDVRLEIDEVGPRVAVYGSRRLLASALGNLMENGVKFSDEHATLSLRVHVEDGWVTMLVHDCGMGIAPGDLPHIFERFYRAPDAYTRGVVGSGLGLAIVRQVATDHGGEVIVESREGRGSSFTLRLPDAAR